MKLKTKYNTAILFSVLWLSASLYFGIPWILDISIYYGTFFAWFSVIGIALIPGIVMAFVNASLLLDRRPKYEKLSNPPPISIIIAAYNEVKNIKITLDSILRQDYPGDIQVFVMDDASTDDTLGEIKGVIDSQKFLKESKSDKYKSNVDIRAVRGRQNVGKANVLNAGLKFVHTPYVITLDGDSELYTDALINIVTKMVNEDEDVAAVAGTILCGNTFSSFVSRLQQWDYIHGIASVKRIQSMYHGTLVAQGAFSLYRVSAIKEMGGWPDKIGEDIVLTWGFHYKGYRVMYSEDAICYTNVPDSYAKFYKQRRRWARGLVEAFKNYPKLLFKFKKIIPFIWYNLLFPYIDVAFLFIFFPGVIAALFMGYYVFASVMTLYLLPLAFLGNLIIYLIQRNTLKKLDIAMPKKNWMGFIFYMFFYQLIMTPATLVGYISEILKTKRVWE